MTSRFSPSSGRTRRRRLLLLQSQTPTTSEVPSNPDESTESYGRVIAPEEPPRFRTFPELLSSEEPITWLFVGDSYTPQTTSPLAWRAFTSRFAGAVRTSFERPRDMFIDGTFPQARLSELMFEFEKRIAKFHPDVCFLSLSLVEADAKSTSRLESMLLRLIYWSSQQGCQLVLQTPPCLPPRNDAELTRQLVFVEALRGIAAEHSLAIVDHWEHWEVAVSKDGLPSSWLNTGSCSPAEEGHRQLARRLLLDLRLNELRRTSSAPNHVVQSLEDRE